jgi:hypothetical protein
MHNISPKVAAATLAAALVTLIVWITSMLGVSIPSEAQGAITIILVALAGYFKTDPSRA